MALGILDGNFGSGSFDDVPSFDIFSAGTGNLNNTQSSPNHPGNPNYMVHIFSVNPSAGSPVIDVKAYLPETFMFDSSSQYEAPFTGGLTGSPKIDFLLKAAGFRIVNQNMTAQIWQGAQETQLGLDLEFHAETDPDLEVRQPILSLLKLATPRLSTTNGFLESPGPKLDKAAIQSFVTGFDQAIKETGGKTLSNIYDKVVGSKLGKTKDPLSELIGIRDSQANKRNAGTAKTANQKFKNSLRDRIQIQIGNYALFDCVVITNVQKTYQSKLDVYTGLPMHATVNIQFKPMFMLVQGDLDRIFLSRGLNTSILSVADSVDASLSSSLDKAGTTGVAQAFPTNAVGNAPTDRF